MQNFQDTLETRKQSFISAFSICITVPLKKYQNIVPFNPVASRPLQQISMRELSRNLFYTILQFF